MSEHPEVLDPRPAAVGHAEPHPHTAPHPHPHAHPTGPAALVAGEPVPRGRVDAVLDAVPARDREARPEGRARAERQRRRWATQVVVADELARRACAARGLTPPAEAALARALAVRGTEVADLGSIIAVALAHSPAARTLLAALEAEQRVPEKAVRGYYDRNPDRFLTSEALRRGVDPYGGAAPGDFLPYDEVHDDVVRELRRAMGRQAFFDWLDRARAEVEYTPGHEHPGDPSHPDHEHRH
ncbi:peptidyl-prolyl cis-trans isomerase [Streptomyces phaeolivaceus]|uniref:peptidyl-prolyl cis-trans isomerase n=1 Tax=Streptomyces phaeolivaceus TaxID=2653200 RepID=UPI001D0561D5|nr:peptidyl-prolyl cis-trans isomerase [Streptomyces phaeolivaceus]